MDIIDLTGDGEFEYPSRMKWKKHDVSGEDAGRTDNILMHKNKLGEKRTLSLGWINLSKERIHKILAAFDPEYVFVKYWDPKVGENVVKEFYTGDMEADVYWWAKGRERYSTLSFDIIER